MDEFYLRERARRRARLNPGRSLPFRRYHRHIPYWVKVLINWYFKRFGDPGDRR